MNPVESRPTAFATHPAWRVALPTLLLALLIILLLFHDTALAMASIWARSDTYAHGFIVPPISLWLIWRLRSSLAALAPRYSYVAVVVFTGAGFVWLLGEVAAVNALSQSALVAMLVLAVPAVLGWEVTRRIAFPLLYLFFAVPVGDFALPKLMDWTAHFTILGLRFSGIPVHSEGLRFVIPSGSWSVVEACSGVRYLIASVTVGTLFAYLTYHSLKRRLLFVAVSFLVPIVANWVRAYMIVMIGHLSGNTLAVGVDHLLYGWVFFGIVILSMFWVGARWREDDVAIEVAPPLATPPAVSAIGSVLAALATVLLGGFWTFTQWQLEHQSRVPQISALAKLGPIAGWQPSATGFQAWQPNYSNYAAHSEESFSKDGQIAGLFLAYYRNQSHENKLVSSTNTLVRSNDPLWTTVDSGTRQVSFNHQDLTVRTMELRGRAAPQMVVWKWYWVDGRWTANDVVAKVYTALSQLTGHGDDSAVIILYTPLAQPGGGERVLAEFAGAAGPAIDAVLRQARDAR